MFAGTDTEGSRDGLASPAEFCQPAGLCVEFDHVLYMCDAQTTGRPHNLFDCVADCYFTLNVLDLPFASPIAIYS